jgi:predicted phage-related endonuclease
MKVQTFANEEDWLEARRGRITGTRLKDLVTKGKPKKGYWEIIAERVAIPHDGENVMDRGKRLEEDAIERFRAETGKKVTSDLVMWQREDDENIAISPDGQIKKGKKITGAVEVKCLSSASHIEAFVTKEIPSEYQYQVLQYFIVNDDLETLYFIFYDTRMPVDFFYYEVTRESVQAEVDEYLALERSVLAQISEIENKLTF